jgi:tetratricopeptide (TPR) repeat protein
MIRLPLSVATLFASILLLSPSLSAAQQPTSPDPLLDAADSALQSCSASAAARRIAEARDAARRAEDAFRSRLAQRPNDVRALVGLARTISQCRIPGAEFMEMGELSAEAISLLQRALELEPSNWVARYILAMNYFGAPAFLGRAADAARELDRLIEQQGQRNDVADFARPYEYRGALWERAGQRDSASVVWERGLRLFPADSALRARLGHDRSQSREHDQPAAPLDAVNVLAARSVVAAALHSPSVRVVRRSEVVQSAGGMADLAQAIQLQPGATRVSEGAELFTRGGDPAETPTLMDAGRVLPLSRFEGLSGSVFGGVDPWVVRSARFSAGGFSVRHGNALSGLLEVETDGRARERTWRASLGLAQAGVTARFPTGARSGGWGTVRATHAGALLRSHGRGGEFSGPPRSIETVGSWIVQPKPGSELRAIGLVARDASARIVDANGFTGPFESKGATYALVLSSQHLSSSAPLMVRSNLSLSQRSSDWGFGVLRRERTERRAISRADLEYAPREGLTLRAGVETGMLARSDAGTLPTTPMLAQGSPVRVLGPADSSTWNSGVYAEGEVLLGRIRIVAGLRADRLPGESGLTADPRLSLSTAEGSWTFRLSGGRFHQGRWRAGSSIPDAGTPSGLPRRATHLVAGVERGGAVSLKAEGFVKSYDQYAPFGAGPSIAGARSRGLDLVVQLPAGERLSGSLGYSLLDASLDLADGRTARSPFDVTHTASGSGTLRLARSTTLGSTLRYGTGRPFTPLAGTTEGSDGRISPVHGAPMSARLPEYVRWDARVMQYVPLGRSLLVGFVEVLNVLDRGNVASYVWDSSYREQRPTHTFYSHRTIVVGFELQGHQR